MLRGASQRDTATLPREQLVARALARSLATAGLVTLVALGLSVPASAVAATTITDVGEGFPVALGASDAVLLAGHANTEEGETEYRRPWSIWVGGAAKVLAPLNGEPAEASAEEEARHALHLADINEAGEAVGTSSLAATKEGKPAVAFHPVVFDAEGTPRDLGVLQEPLTEKTGESEEIRTFPGGGFGTAINDSGSAVGEGVVDVEGKITPRAFLSAGGGPIVVGAADGLAKPWRSAAFFINDSGLMFGEVAEVGEGTPSHFYLWPDATSAGTALNFDAGIPGHDLANDGSVMGLRKGQVYLRLPKGEEQAVNGLSNPGQVNSAHDIVGSETVKGAEHAALWSAGTVTDLNSRLPEKSGWVLERAYDINDAGDIAGVGTHEGKRRVFLLQGGLLASISGTPSVALPESGTATETFNVTLPAPSATTVTVGYRTEDDTATVANNDYTPASGTLTFLPGETSKPVEVQIDTGNGHDTLATESYRVRLQATSTAGVSATAGSAEGDIGLPGLGGELVAAPASGAPGRPVPAAGMQIKIDGRTATGQEVTQTLTSGADGRWEAHVDAGVYSVTASGLPPGQPGGLEWSPSARCPGKRKGPSCVEVRVKATNGVPVYREVNFGYGQRDPQVENIEVIQAVQLKKYDASGPEVALAGVGKVASMAYSGVGLVADSPTVARVYASNNGAGAAQSVAVQLAGYDAATGRLLPGSPLTPVNGELDALPAPAEAEERADAAATFNFQLPAAWTHGNVVLLATADPAQKFPECAGCRENDNLALTGIPFTAVPALKFAPISLDWTEGTTVHSPRDPLVSVLQTWPFWPLPTGGLTATKGTVHVDLTEALAATAKALKAMPALRGKPLGFNTKSLTGCLGWSNEACSNVIAPKIFAAERAALGDEAGLVLGVGVYDDTGYQFGVLGEASGIPGSYNYTAGNAEHAATVVHEMLHDLGFKHTGCTGPGDEEPWPPNRYGQASLLGFGLDRSLTSLGGIGPIMRTTGSAAGRGTHDIMSYCYPTWPSSLNWDRTLRRLTEGPVLGLPKPYTTYSAYASLTASTAARARSTVTVSAVEVAGEPFIAEVSPGAIAEGGEESTPFVAQARNARGRVLASVPIRGRSAHADTFGAGARPDEQLLMQFELPAAGAAKIDIAQGSKVLSSTSVPRSRPRLRVARVSGAACRRVGALKLAYSASPAGGAFAHVRVLAQSGRSWKTIEVGAQGSRIVLARGSRPHGARSLRVEFNDGFAAATASVNLPAGCRAA